MRNLSRVLTGTINSASEVPDPGVRLTRGLGPATGKTTSRAVPPPNFSRRYGGAQRHQGLTRKHLSFPDRAMASALRAQEGDFRNWAEIRDWATGIADALLS